MAQQTINVGAAPNDGTGTPLRTAFQYTNSNFSELYTATGPSGNNITVPGTATISGDLTVDTNTLKVDSANNRVGIQVASPSDTLDIGANDGTAKSIALRYSTLPLFLSSTFDGTNGISTLSINNKNTSTGSASWASAINTTYGSSAIQTLSYIGGGEVRMFTSSSSNAVPSERYRIDNTGVSTWSVGGSTAMTLNATGLGVGDAPATNARLTIGSTNATGFQYALRTTGITTGRSQIYLANTSGDLVAGIEGSTAGATITGSAAYSTYIGTATSNPFYLVTGGSVRATVDASGNVGIGVTPSAWAAGIKGLQIGSLGGSSIIGYSNACEIGSNFYFDTGYKYGATAASSQIQFTNGEIRFKNAASGTAGNAITYSQPMTLDGSGNLILQPPSSPPTLGTNGQLTVNATSNTNLRFSYRGSDGVTRVANITLA